MKNNNTLKWILVWVLAVLLTGAATVYQSMNGPTKPKREELKIDEEQIYKFSFTRSHGGNTDCPLKIIVPDPGVSAAIIYRRFPSNGHWEEIVMIRTGDTLTAELPVQPPAGKLEYFLKFHREGLEYRVPEKEQIVIRFRGDVPAGIIIPHASLMFFAMLFSNVALFLALFNMKKYRLYAWITISAIFIGGLIFGPIVQKYAFGEYWTGFPNGMDLTDNKTLIAFVIWLIAAVLNIKKDRKFLTVAAAVIMLVIFSIPHSVRGSELDPETGRIKTGMIINPKA